MKVRNFWRTELGECYVYTKTKGKLYGEPLTKVGPIHYSELGDFRLSLLWRTNDPAELQKLHSVVLKVIKEPGVAETFLQIRAALRARRKLPNRDQLAESIKAKSAQIFAESKALGTEEIQLVTANLKSVS